MMEIPVVLGSGSVLLDGLSTVQSTPIIKKPQLPPIVEYEAQYPPAYYAPPPLPPPMISQTSYNYSPSIYRASSSPLIRTSDLGQQVRVQSNAAGRINFFKDLFFLFFGMVLTGVPLAVVTAYYLQDRGPCTTITTTTTTTTITTTTTTNGTFVLPSQCTSYTTINDPTRSILAGTGSLCDNTLITRWYRFIGNGTKLATTHVSRDTCTTFYGGSYNGTMPTIPGTTAYGTYCANRDGYLCHAASSGQPISVTHCNTFFVYYLQRPFICNSRYCTTD